MNRPPFRVLAGPNPHLLYSGDDIHTALQVLYEALPDGPLLIGPTTHAITGEPTVVFRDGNTGLTIAALCGITFEEWNAAYAFWSTLSDDDGDPADRKGPLQ